MSSKRYEVFSLEKHDLCQYISKKDVTHISNADMKKITMQLRNAILQGIFVEKAIRIILQDMGYELYD